MQSSRCGHFTGKHKYLIHSAYPGHFVVMFCTWTLCQQRKVIPHEVLVRLMVR